MNVAIQVRDMPGEGTWLCNLGIVYGEIGNFQQALKILEPLI